MNLDSSNGRRSVSPASSDRSSPVPRVSRRAVEDGLYKADKGLRRYALIVEKALSTWETAPQEWADYIACMGRLLKAIQSHPKNVPLLPHSEEVASKLAQCLNPALPSGVHQKALEVYSYIFLTFGTDYLSSHLHDYLPGLASVLSFASLSVRPGLYVLFEDHIVKLPRSTLRPTLKSLILALLPAIEEETSEDFERAFAILQSLEQQFVDDEPPTGYRESYDGYFWQCLFLCVVTSSSRRQGALNYLARRMPKFTSHAVIKGTSSDIGDNGTSDQLSAEAQAAISPEPGLLIRCFVAGLSDHQLLTQRGFLDLLVAHLPLHSVVLREKVQSRDLDQLISAALQILLRKDMSLNRRLWLWFMGPEPTDTGTPSSPKLQQKVPQEAHSSSQFDYFTTYVNGPLLRVILSMLASNANSPAQVARPFRICLSLMDRWEIGGSLVPRIFLRALESVYVYSMKASSPETSEVLRSASLFFDGIEASLIWATFCNILQAALEGEDGDFGRLQLLLWTLENFNVRDEEMATVHAPLTLSLLTSLLNERLLAVVDGPMLTISLDIAEKLLELVPPRALGQQKDMPQSSSTSSAGDTDVRRAISGFYREPSRSSDRLSLPFDRLSLAYFLHDQVVSLTIRALDYGLDTAFFRIAPLLQTILSKAPSIRGQSVKALQQGIQKKLTATESDGIPTPFQSSNAIISLLVALKQTNQITRSDLLVAEPLLSARLWQYMSPTAPKFHVEAVRALWQLESLVAPDDTLQVSLMGLMRSVNHVPDISTPFLAEAGIVRRFAVLWNHSIPAQSLSTKPAAFGHNRRGSAMPNSADTAQAAWRLQVLTGPLLLLLDTLRDPSSIAFESARGWLSSLPSLNQVFYVLFQRLESVALDEQTTWQEDMNTVRRGRRDRQRYAVYVLSHFENLLRNGNDWTWQSLNAAHPRSSFDQTMSGTTMLARICARLLSDTTAHSPELDRQVVMLLDALISGPNAAELQVLNLDSLLMDRLLDCLNDDADNLQGILIDLIPKAIRLGLPADGRDQPESRPRASLSTKRPSSAAQGSNGTGGASSTAHSPPPQLLRCLRMGFTSKSARPNLDQWLQFLDNVLPTVADAIFASLLPLVECLCHELEGVFSDLVAMTQLQSSPPQFYSPDAVCLCLLEGLDIVLARAHDCLVQEDASENDPQHSAPQKGIFGAVTSGVFKAEGPPSKTAQANSRLTVILAFQDSIRVCLKMWAWSSRPAESEEHDRSCAATTAYSSLRLRNKTRHLLEQIFSVEPLESLEVVIAHARYSVRHHEAGAALNLLHVMQGSRPKNVVPAILDALCSRANPVALLSSRQSSQTVDLTAVDVALFLLDYLESIEDDAMDEVWSDGVAFLRDVLANPLPYHQVLPPLLSLVNLLAHKLANTNFGEQRKMRRELGDIFQRLLAATLTTVPSSFMADTPLDNESTGFVEHQDVQVKRAKSLFAVLTEVVRELEAILETPERATAAVNSISNGLIAPIFHSKSFPVNVSQGVLDLLLELARKAPTAKNWKKEVTDAFNDPRLFALSLPLVERGWLPVLLQWSLRDKDRMADLLTRLTPPSSAGIMFGVGATAARLEADRRTQLNLRRVCLLLLASPEDAWVAYVREFVEKFAELSGATESSSPSSAIRAELFMLYRALVLSLSPIHLSPLWPGINDSLQAALSSPVPDSQTSSAFTNLGLLQCCRLLDQLILQSPDDFQLHEWLYITDTTDAVYQPTTSNASALADQVAEALGSSGIEDNEVLSPQASASAQSTDHRRSLLPDVDGGDVRAMARDDFAKAVLRPFLSQLSIHAYEGMYSMQPPDVEACRQSLLRDLFDLSTIVD